ncbi:hypothetical protein EYR38_010543 [Pleurotus pulmonarius]|nr:hypothetical protein EYR38_010543 [Pleurotus pulmonarius]
MLYTKTVSSSSPASAMSFDKSATAVQVETAFLKLRAEEAEEEFYDLQTIGELVDSLTFENVDKRGSMVLSLLDEPSWQSTELIVRVVGALIGQDLPPRRRPVAHRERAYARQHVKLAGLGAPSFDRAIQQLVGTTQQFNRFFEPGEWIDWTPPKTDDGFVALEANCRYFTPMRFSEDHVDVPFDVTVDPQHHLERSKDGQFIHTADNIVEFYQKNDVDNSYDTFDPKGFRDGDIVAAHVAFLAVKIKGQASGERKGARESEKYQMLVVLRGLTLLARNEQGFGLIQNTLELRPTNSGFPAVTTLRSRFFPPRPPPPFPPFPRLSQFPALPFPDISSFTPRFTVRHAASKEPSIDTRFFGNTQSHYQ